MEHIRLDCHEKVEILNVVSLGSLEYWIETYFLEKKSGMTFGLGTRLGVTKQKSCKTGEISQVTEQKCLLTEKTSRMTRQATAPWWGRLESSRCQNLPPRGDLASEMFGFTQTFLIWIVHRGLWGGERKKCPRLTQCPNHLKHLGVRCKIVTAARSFDMLVENNLIDLRGLMNWDDCLKRRWNLLCYFDKNKTLPSFSFIVRQLPPFIAVGGQLLPTGYQTNKTWSWPTSPCEMPSFSFSLAKQ